MEVINMKNEIVYEGNFSSVYRLYDDLYFREGNLEIRDQCNCGFVVLKNCVALIDYPGQNPEEEIIDEAEKIVGLPVKYIFVTHAHVDHVAGFRTLKRKDIKLITRKSSIEQLYLEGYPVPPIELAVENTMDVVLDSQTIHVEVPETTAHSPWDMIVEIPEYKIIFAGDLIALQKNMFFHSSNIKGWITTIDKLIPKDYKFIVRGHGPIVGAEFLNDVAKYLRLLDNAREWQRRNNEDVNPESVRNATMMLSPELAVIVQELLQYADAVNVARQINQLFYKLR
jgi:glyoxylase-like metal-dependent hydrolase (beta-lactamase superfamily II)